MKLTRELIQWAVNDLEWQQFRETLRGRSDKERLAMMNQWLIDHHNTLRANVQVQNYVNALKRAGRLKDGV